MLIDGDHNWYTVFNELKTVERLCAERSQDFPLVLLHDIGWPYGRRDLYYDPKSIPEEHRKPYDKKGMLPSVPDLVEEGGMNRHLNNAVREHEPKDGVLTAIEDFLGASQYALDLLELPGVHGLGILAPEPLKRTESGSCPTIERVRLLSTGRTLRAGSREGTTGTAGAPARGTQGIPAAAGSGEPRTQRNKAGASARTAGASARAAGASEGRQELEQVRRNLREVRQKLKKPTKN